MQCVPVEQAGPLSPQAGRPPLSRDSATLPRVPSNERLYANTPSKEKPRAAPVMLKPGHKVTTMPTLMSACGMYSKMDCTV